MGVGSRKPWVLSVVFVGVVYSAIGIGSAWLANPASSQLRVMWRLTAWLMSAAVYTCHFGYEHFRLCNSAGRTAWHVALAVAIGAFGLAVAANIHGLWVGSNYKARLAIALVAWPVLTAVPALLVALIAAGGLRLTRRKLS